MRARRTPGRTLANLARSRLAARGAGEAERAGMLARMSIAELRDLRSILATAEARSGGALTPSEGERVRAIYAAAAGRPTGWATLPEGRAAEEAERRRRWELGRTGQGVRDGS